MRIVLLTLVILLTQAVPSFAKCKKSDICTMMEKMDHFSILNACPGSAPLLKECKKVKFTCGFKKGGYTDDPFFREHHNTKLEQNLVYTNEAGITGLFFPYLQILGGVPKDLYDYLKNHILQDKYRYDHYWEDGDVVISEQWLTIHKRHAFEKMNERLMYRIAID